MATVTSCRTLRSSVTENQPKQGETARGSSDTFPSPRLIGSAQAGTALYGFQARLQPLLNLRAEATVPRKGDARGWNPGQHSAPMSSRVQVKLCLVLVQNKMFCSRKQWLDFAPPERDSNALRSPTSCSPPASRPPGPRRCPHASPQRHLLGDAGRAAPLPPLSFRPEPRVSRARRTRGCKKQAQEGSPEGDGWERGVALIHCGPVRSGTRALDSDGLGCAARRPHLPALSP